MSFSRTHGARRARGAKLTILRLGIVAPAVTVHERFPIIFLICGGGVREGRWKKCWSGHCMHLLSVSLDKDAPYGREEDMRKKYSQASKLRDCGVLR